MTLNEIIKVINGKTNINSDKVIKNIKTDSRKIEKGDVFIALKGPKYDGHLYTNDAIKKGAIACITEYDINNSIVVEDTYEVLYLLGNYIRKKYNLSLIAITGSNGKTTTKELLYHILSSKYNILKNHANKNNLIGVSDTLFRLNSTYDLIIIELGTNHFKEISYLSNMCNPNYSIITNIGSSHLEYFKTRKNIFKEKYSIVDGMNNIKLIVNGDDKYLKKLNCFKCGIKCNNDLIAYNIKENINSILFSIYLDKEYVIEFKNPGKHFINDILLAIKTSLDYGINIKTIIKRIKSFKMVEKRMNVVYVNTNVIINDCYNSSYESIKAGINYLKNINSNKVLIIGDILELGKHSKRIHKKINKLLKKLHNKRIFTIGKYSKYISGINFNSSIELINYLKNNKISNSYIYLKGSRKMNLDIIYDYLNS